ncbi:phosphoribosylformylglycinamidine cyclo-ligase [bacterium BMS3Abin01]|nr:phosphoribosylformylglycinamidine cyclo-ligase [bacterium BMS3Abin01]
MTYAGAGVDIDAGAEVVRRIRRAVASTTGDTRVIGGLGGFAGMMELPGMEQPVLVSATDGVGTKVLVAEALGRYDTVGIDLVAMSANDLLTTGARPLFFLDYLATGKLEPEKAASLVEGVAAGCRRAGCALLGGETAEMPDLYRGGEFDLAGFAVGVVERDDIIDGSSVSAGDAIIGLPASGIHSNGFSLVRKALAAGGISYRDNLEGAGPGPVGEKLLIPTEIYAPQVAALMSVCRVGAMAHITGGGLPDNLPRVIPDGLGARIDRSAWLVPRLFTSIQELGNIETREMFHTFNMGIGYVVVVPPGDVEKARRAAHGAIRIGEVIEGEAGVDLGI